MTDNTGMFLNNQKRTMFAVCASLGAMQGLEEASQFGEAYISNILPKDSYLGKLIVATSEAFPTGALLTVAINGTDVIVTEAIDILGGITTVDIGEFASVNGSITLTVTGGTGDIAKGAVSAFVDCVSMNELNGAYVVDVPLTPYGQ